MDKNPFQSDDMWKGAFLQIFSNAKKLREKPTEAKEKLWLAVKNNQIEGYKFRRQLLLVSILLIFIVMP